jgi:uncharacterized protein (TIGR03032 family)
MDTASNASPNSTDGEPEFETRWREVRYEYTPRLPEILCHLDASLLVTTYQAGKLVILGVHEGRLKISFCDFDQPMGLAVRSDRLAIGTRRQIHFLVGAPETAASVEPKGTYNGCFVPRTSFYTGSIHGHDLAWGSEGLWIVNTLFSCLCTLHEGYSFVPRWRPRFITELADQDRCHLNGLALEHGQPKYVTVLSESNEPAGWRPTKATGGCVIDVSSKETIARGLAMPHSPRVHGGRLWVLDSGNGSLGTIDRATGRYDTVEKVPGYTRGLAFAGQFAFVGLSKIRETAVFGGVPIAEKRDELHCGLAAVDLISGRTVAVFQFQTGVSEIFAVDVLPGMSNPIVGGSSVDQHERDVWIVPRENAVPPVVQPVLPLFAESSRDRPPAAPAGSHVADVSQWAAQARQFQAAGRLDDAAKCLEQAIAVSAQPVPLLVNLGNLRQEQGNSVAALRCYHRAVEHDPNCVPARQNLGYLFFNLGQPEQALKQYDHLLRIEPSPMNRLLAASVLPVVYDSADELRRWRSQQLQAHERMVRDHAVVDAASQLVPTSFYWAYQGENDRQVMSLRGQIIQGSTATFGTTKTHGRDRHSDGRVRIAFLSAYFRDHTIGRLNIGRVERLDRQRFHVTVLMGMPGDDPMAARFRNSADRFVRLSRDVATARREVTNLDLDVLIFADVGMDALCSTLAFSRMAPVQCATWGHPDTTGSPTIDYFLSSDLLEPAGSDSHYTEKLVRLPLLGIYYERPCRTGPPRTREFFGLPDDRRVYLCPQNLFKFHPDFDQLLAGILQADQQGEIVILEGRVPEWSRRLQHRFRRTLPDADRRVRYVPSQPYDEFLALLGLADVVLDPIHFGGGNTSYETFAMGTPIVTWPGDYLRGRITLALYRKMGIEDLVVDSADSYVRQAVRLANDEPYRRETQQRIVNAAACLFEDPDEVRVLEDFLWSVSE